LRRNWRLSGGAFSIAPHMQSPKEFIQSYLKEKARVHEMWSNAWKPVHARFFQPDYRPLSPEKSAALSKAETVLDVANFHDSAVVITSGYGERFKLRYTLLTVGESWQISQIDLECAMCRTTGKRNEKECKLCGGKGWKTMQST